MTDPHTEREVPEEPEFDEELVELVSASLDGALTPAEEERLADLLAQDPQLHAYRERMRRIKRLVAGAPLVAASAGPERQRTLDSIRARLTDSDSADAPPATDWRVKLGIVGCVLGLLFVTWQAVSLSRTINDRSTAPPQQSELGPVPEKQPDVDAPTPPVEAPDVDPPEAPDEPQPPVDPPQPPVEPPQPPDEPDDPPQAPDTDTTPPELPEGPVVADTPDDPVVPPRDPDEGTRVRPPDEDPAPPALDLAALKRLVAGIHDASTPLAQRPSLIRSLGDARFDHPLAYQTLSGILAGTFDRTFPIGQVGGVPVGPAEWRQAARLACARLDTALAVRTLLGSLDAQPDEAPAFEAALAAMRSPASVEALASSLSGRVSATQAEAAVRALAAIGDPDGRAAVLEVYGNDRLPAPLVRQAALAVGSLGDPACLDLLVEGLDDKRLAVRTGSAGGLGRLGARLPECATASVAALATAVRGRELALSSAAVEALAAVGEPAVPTLIGCLDPQQEPRAAVRDLAREQLWLLSGEALADSGLAADWWKKHTDEGLPLTPPNAVVVVDDTTSPLSLAAWGERVVFMLDTSGSMEGAKWARTQAEVERALEAYASRRDGKERGWANLLAFSDAPRFVRPGFANVSSRRGRAGLIELLGRLKPVGVAQTKLLKAMQALQKIPKVDTVVLISDAGESAEGLAQTFAYVRRSLGQRPLRFHTVLLVTGGGKLAVDRRAGSPDDPAGVAFMRRLARETGGLFVREFR